MLIYQNISDIDKEGLLKCCGSPIHSAPAPPSGDCCYDTWGTDLTTIIAQLKEAKAIADHKQTHYDHAIIWRDNLSSWCKDWEDTDEKVDALCRQLSGFIVHLENVCRITKKTNQSIEILFCMTEDLYKRVDKLKISYDDLVKCITCLKRPELTPGMGIMKAIEDYGKKLDAIIATRDILISQIIMAIELAYGLRANVCKQYGLIEELKYLKDKLNCCEENEAEEKGKPNPYQHSNKINEPASHVDDCCYLEPHISFPIDKDKYYIKLETEYSEAKVLVAHLKIEVDNANNKVTALTASKTGIQAAIAGIDATNKCK